MHSGEAIKDGCKCAFEAKKIIEEPRRRMTEATKPRSCAELVTILIVIVWISVLVWCASKGVAAQTLQVPQVGVNCTDELLAKSILATTRTPYCANLIESNTTLTIVVCTSTNIVCVVGFPPKNALLSNSSEIVNCFAKPAARFFCSALEDGTKTVIDAYVAMTEPKVDQNAQEPPTLAYNFTKMLSHLSNYTASLIAQEFDSTGKDTHSADDL